MTDDTNEGAVPPPPIPAAPPPLADAPPPIPQAPLPPPSPPVQAAPQPVPAPYYPPRSSGGKGGWIVLIILSFILGAGAAVLTLWLSGELWNSRPAYSSGGQSNYAGSGSAGSSPSMGTSGPAGSGSAYGNASTDAPPSGSGYAPTPYALRGTWGPNCPGARNDVITLYDNGVAEGGAGERGNWSLSGNYVTLSTGTETVSLYWEMLGDGIARVRRSGDNRTGTIYRCP